VRLREKGGKRHAMPCHHNLEESRRLSRRRRLTQRSQGAAVPHDRTRRRQADTHRLPQANAYAMVRRRVARRRHRNRARQAARHANSVARDARIAERLVRGRFDEPAGFAAAAGFGGGTTRRTSIAGLSSRRPS
jgi:hypothetical protein